MKLNKTFLIIPLASIFLIILFTPFFHSCEKESVKVMKVKLDSVYDITEESAKAIGTVLDLGDGIEQHGHCWSKNPAPVYGEDGVGLSEKGEVNRVGTYTSNISPLEPETKYYIRAYIRKGDEIKHSEEELSFTTSGIPISLPVVTIGSSAQNLTPNEATVSGTIEDIGTGAESISEHGHCWSTITTTPTVNDPTKTSLGARASTGSYTSTLSSLSAVTTYHVRAYATNPAGTAYSNNISFTTPGDVSVPTVTTTEATDITNNSAVSGGNVTSNGGAEVTARGVCWNISPNPTLTNASTTNGTGTGVYTSNITGLSSGTTYHVRAYATNSIGTAYGEDKSFTTEGGDPNANWEPGDDWVDVRDGQAYATVPIGDQVWMAENLNVGTQITTVKFPENNSIIEKYCYNDDKNKCNEYGGLYTWDEMMNYQYVESAQGICPDGWHLPSDYEWADLETYLGMDPGELYSTGFWRGTNEASMLKEGGSTGFDALMAGYWDYFEDSFYVENEYCYFWTTTEIDYYYPFFRCMHYNTGTIFRSYDYAGHATSVRCIKDETYIYIEF
jgi:uncharacterized protein (TIGR02145 family)